MPLGPAEVIHGPIFLGVIFNVLLYGIMIAQLYTYYSSSAKDPLWMKFLVWLVFLCDTLNTVFDVMYTYTSLVVHFDDPKYLTRADWVFSTEPAMTAIIATLVQMFFARRVKVLTGNMWWFLCIMLFAITGLLSGIGTSVACGIVPSFVEFNKFKSVVIVWVTSNVIGDIAITASLTAYLVTRKTGYVATDDMVDRIIRLTVQTGLVTSICAALGLFTFLIHVSAVPGIYLTFNFALAKLYSNSLMSSLNARSKWQPMTGIHTTGRNVNATTPFAEGVDLNSVADGDPARRPKQVFVHVERHQMQDWKDADPKQPRTSSGKEDFLVLKTSLEYDNPEVDTDSTTRTHPYAGQRKTGLVI